jgi:hypothetical protein
VRFGVRQNAHDFHPEHPRVKRASAVDTGDGEYEVIKAFDIHRIDPFPSAAAGAQNPSR